MKSLNNLVNGLVDGAKKAGKLVAKPAGILSLSAILYTGCAPNIERNFPEGHVYGTEFRSETQDDHPYQMEEVVLYGEHYFVRHEKQKENTLPISFSRFDDNNYSFKKNELIPTSKYIPVRVRVGEGADAEWLKWVRLKVKDSKLTGVRGVKANIKRPSKTGYGYTLGRTEQDISYSILQIEILGDKYYFPHVEESKIDTTGIWLNSYLLRDAEEDSTDGLAALSDGQVTLTTSDYVYRPLLDVLVDGYLGEIGPAEPSPGEVDD